MKRAFTMEVTVPILSEQGQQEQRREPRRSVRAGVALRVIVVDKGGLASGQVIDMTARGCGLRLTKPLTRGQYLTLMGYPNDRTVFMQCDVGQVQWVKADRAGVAFLGISQDHEQRVRQLYSERLLFEFAE
jgi:PilZ domain